jgi:hypothetical protein
VIKPSNSTYLTNHGWIKLKKDHIPGLGDTLDFCVIGAGFDTKRAQTTTGKLAYGVKWNVWHIGCLENKQEVIEQVYLLLFLLMIECATRICSIVYGDLESSK